VELEEFALDFARRPTVAKALDLDRVLRESETSELAAAKNAAWAESEYTRAALADRYEPKPYDLRELADMPSRTLGHAYGTHMLQNGLSPDFYERTDTTSDPDYIRNRIYQTHDIVHVLCGYTTSTLDESGVTGFYFGQQDRYHGPGGGLLMQHSIIQQGAVFLHAGVHDPEHGRLQVRAFIDGYNRGYAAEPFLSYRLEEMFELPIEDVRRQIGITPRAA
jgi:ubiquinone biosynthesis protein Coq4